MACSGAFQAYDGGDVAGSNFGNVFTLVGLQAHNAAYALFLASRAVEDIAAGLDLTGVDTEVRQLAHEWVAGDLECQGAKRFGVGVLALDFVAGLRVCAPSGRTVGWRRQK